MSIEIEAAPAPVANGKVHKPEVREAEVRGAAVSEAEVRGAALREEELGDLAEWEKTPRPERRLNLRRLIIPAAAVVLVIGAAFGVNMYREGQMYVSTDNAQLTGTPVQVGAMNAGRVQSILPSVGATVHKGDTLAVVDLPSQVGTAQNGQPKLDFLPNGDSTVTVQSPLDGVVLSVPTTPGATVQAGQALVTLVDPGQMWVNANIEETNVSKVKVGQQVSVHVDALGTDVPGRVDSITPATANSFSLLPTSNTSGNFTKVTQLVPVRISVNLGNQPALLGSSVEVKVRVA
jgi:multidrug resistance efflux pump